MAGGELCGRKQLAGAQADGSPSLGSPGLQPPAARSMAVTQRPLSSSVSALKVWSWPDCSSWKARGSPCGPAVTW